MLDVIWITVFIFRNWVMEDVSLLLYVDDMLISRSNMQHANALKRKLTSTFAMKDWGTIKQILGVHIVRDKKNQK